MAFDLNNFVIDRVVRGVATDMTTGDVLFAINQITNPSLNCTSESTDAVDALNVPIATFYRAKTCEFSAENALFDMSLLAAQTGTAKKIASSTAKITTPCFQTIDVEAAKTSYTLSHTPKTSTTPKIYVLKGDGTLGEKVTIESTASARKVALAGTTLTVVVNQAAQDQTPAVTNGFDIGEQLFVMYEYEADGNTKNGAVEVVNSATQFPVGCKFVMEILGADVCDQTNLIYAYLVFPNAKLSPDFDWSIATDSTHPFSLKAMQEYCDSEKRLFSIIIPE